MCAFSPASRTSLATGAAVAPPAPSFTSSTPTPMRGCSAGANAANQASVLLVSLAVPCHRIVGSDGNLTGYRWGVPRKRALLEKERAAAGN